MYLYLIAAVVLAWWLWRSWRSWRASQAAGRYFSSHHYSITDVRYSLHRGRPLVPPGCILMIGIFEDGPHPRRSGFAMVVRGNEVVDFVRLSTRLAAGHRQVARACRAEGLPMMDVLRIQAGIDESENPAAAG